ncbi:deacylase, partial [Desulfovibrio sp. OttesenSCG-928-G11]|nr:deacylase [Desulfovibrio sp. OttesenSCG-928-G11]
AEQWSRHPFARDSAPFILRKMGDGSGPTLLVIGGIQGDEPGGFSAAALLASHYRILSGNVWVVPDLNFPSILERHRGIFGDMNRKFAALDPGDPEFATIKAIKAVLLSEPVDLVLNLHDGSGFYRPTWEDALRNPKRWGQSVIIDQEEMEAPGFNMLFETAGFVESEVNRALLDPVHRYHTYNTLTAEGNKEMAKTLSWFAVCNGKPAFGIEASKEVSTEYRAYYHLNVIEAFMRRMDIAFERDFPLNPAGVTGALNSGLALTAFEGRLALELDNVRPVLNHVPFKIKAAPEERASKPLLALVPDKRRGDWRVAYGNRTLTRLNPDYMEFDDSLTHVDLLVDGQPQRAAMGEVVNVARSFKVQELEGYRVNAIGAQKELKGTEAGVLLKHADFMPRFSLDKNATLFRVELYKGKAFAGMLLVRFGDGPHRPGPAFPESKPLTATQGRESDLGL